MPINDEKVKGKWMEIKGEVKKAWGKLTDDEIMMAKGDFKAIGGLIEQKYGEKKESYEKKLSEILSRFETKKEGMVEKVKESLKS